MDPDYEEASSTQNAKNRGGETRTDDSRGNANVWTPTAAGRQNRSLPGSNNNQNNTPAATLNFILHTRQRNEELRQGRGNTPADLGDTTGTDPNSQSLRSHNSFNATSRSGGGGGDDEEVYDLQATLSGTISTSIAGASRSERRSSPKSNNPTLNDGHFPRQKASYVPPGYCVVLSADDHAARLLRLQQTVRKRCACAIGEWWAAVLGKQRRKTHAARLRNLILLNARVTLIQQWWRTLQSRDLNTTTNNSSMMLLRAPSSVLASSQHHQQQRVSLGASFLPEEGGASINTNAASGGGAGLRRSVNRDRSLEEALALLGRTEHLEEILEGAKGEIIRAERAAVSHVRHAGIKKIWEGVTDEDPVFKRMQDLSQEQLSPARTRQRKWALASTNGSPTASEEDRAKDQMAQRELNRRRKKQLQLQKSQQDRHSGGSLFATRMNSNNHTTTSGGFNGGVKTFTGRMPPLLSSTQERSYRSRQRPERGQQGRYLTDEDAAISRAAQERDRRLGRENHHKNSQQRQRRSATALGFELVPLDRTLPTPLQRPVEGDPSLDLDATLPLRVSRPLATPQFWNGSTQTKVPWWYSKPTEAQKFKRVPELVKYL